MQIFSQNLPLPHRSSPTSLPSAGMFFKCMHVHVLTGLNIQKYYLYQPNYWKGLFLNIRLNRSRSLRWQLYVFTTLNNWIKFYTILKLMFISMYLVKYLNVLCLKPCWLNFTKTNKTGKTYGWEMTIIIQMIPGFM